MPSHTRTAPRPTAPGGHRIPGRAATGNRTAPTRPHRGHRTALTRPHRPAHTAPRPGRTTARRATPAIARTWPPSGSARGAAASTPRRPAHVIAPAPLRRPVPAPRPAAARDGEHLRPAAPDRMVTPGRTMASGRMLTPGRTVPPDRTAAVPGARPCHPCERHPRAPAPPRRTPRVLPEAAAAHDPATAPGAPAAHDRVSTPASRPGESPAAPRTACHRAGHRHPGTRLSAVRSPPEPSPAHRHPPRVPARPRGATPPPLRHTTPGAPVPPRHFRTHPEVPCQRPTHEVLTEEL